LFEYGKALVVRAKVKTARELKKAQYKPALPQIWLATISTPIIFEINRNM